jgi:putative flippase GtrA
MEIKYSLETLFERIGRWICKIIDHFYPLFRKTMPIQFFRYGVTGVVNLVFDWILYFVIYNFVLQKKMLHLGIVTLSSHIAAFVIKFPIVLLSGFLLQKYVTFTESNLREEDNYLDILLCMELISYKNYFGLKFFVDLLHIFRQSLI